MSQRYIKGDFVQIPNISSLKGQIPSVISVYFWICTHADDDGVCYPSRKTISEEANISLDTVDVAIKKLEELEILAKESRRNGKEYTSNIYQIMLVEKGGSRSIRPGNRATPTVTIPIEQYIITDTKKFVSKVPLKKKFGSYDESSSPDDLPAVDLDSGDFIGETPKKAKVPKNQLALDAQSYFLRACERAVGTKPSRNDKGYYLILKAISNGLIDASILRKRIDDWFASGEPIEKLVQITHCFSDYSVNAWKVANGIK